MIGSQPVIFVEGRDALEDNQNPTPSVDEYIAQAPEDVRPILARIRAIVKEAAPQAEERIGYGMPSYYLNGYLLGFAAFKKHIGLYPTPAGIDAFKDELARYKGAKGSVQFPLNQPMPYDLIGKLARARVAEKTKKKA